jgi:hypothetical protein
MITRLQRIYLRPVEAAQGMMRRTPTRSGFALPRTRRSRDRTESPKPWDFIAGRRALILSLIASTNRPSPLPQQRRTSAPIATLCWRNNAGSAQLSHQRFALCVSWISLSNWVVHVPVAAGLTSLQIAGVDAKGRPVAAATGHIGVTFVGGNESPEGKVVFNEIMYHAPVDGAEYVELFNRSETIAFNLSGWIIDGIDFVFPTNTIIEAGAFLVVVKELSAFTRAYGAAFQSQAVCRRVDHGGRH